MFAEVIDGKLYAWRRGRPGPLAHFVTAIQCDVGSCVDAESKTWWMLHRPEIHLADHVLVPDIAAWRRERLPTIPEQHFDVAPDWVCEVPTTESRRVIRSRKLSIYAEHGISSVWIAEPLEQFVEALELADGRWCIAGVYDDVMRAVPFDDVAVNLSTIWTP